MEGLKEEVAEKHHLVMGDFDLEAKRRNLTDSHASEEHTSSFLPFKRWLNSFRAKRSYSPCQRLRYVEGWSDTTQTRCENTNALPCGGGQDLIQSGDHQDEYLERCQSKCSEIKGNHPEYESEFWLRPAWVYRELKTSIELIDR